MNPVKLHLGLLTYLPLIGFAAYAILTGFSNPFFLKIFLTGWIIVAIYQTILTAVYTPPQNPLLSFLALILPALLLAGSAYYRTSDFSAVFIELAAIDLIGMIVGLIYAFSHKATTEGTQGAPTGAIAITVGILLTAGFFLVKFVYHFFEIQKFDWILMLLILIGIARSAYFFSSRLTQLTNRIGIAKKTKSGEASAKPAREQSARGILLAMGIWFILIPLGVWVRSLIIPYQ